MCKRSRSSNSTYCSSREQRRAVSANVSTTIHFSRLLTAGLEDIVRNVVWDNESVNG